MSRYGFIDAKRTDDVDYYLSIIENYINDNDVDEFILEYCREDNIDGDVNHKDWQFGVEYKSGDGERVFIKEYVAKQIVKSGVFKKHKYSDNKRKYYIINKSAVRNHKIKRICKKIGETV